jgi:hypothetical protein
MVFGRLTISYSDGSQAAVTLEKPTVRIGSAPDNDIVLADALVDPYHAQLLCGVRGCQILDLGSTSGTLLNGGRLPAQQPRTLANDNIIQIGGTRIAISISGAAGRAAATGRLGARAQDEDLLTSLLGRPTGGNGRARVTPTLGTAQPAISTAPTEPVPVAMVVPAPQLHLSLNLADLALDAGGTGMITVTVINSSNIVDRIEVLVEGLPATWIKTVPPSHSLFPGAKGETQIVIAPPRAPTSVARTYPFSIVAQSEQRPADRIAESAELTVLPYSEFRLDQLEPKEQTAWMQANYMLQIANRGNQDQSYEFQGANDQDAFVFRTIPAPFVVGPGASGRARLTTRLRFLRWFGKPQTHQFTVSATPADASAATQQVAGRFVQNPPLPPWMLILLAALLVLALLGCCWYFLGARVFALFTRSTPTPTAIVGTPTPTLPVGGGATAEPSPLVTPVPTPDAQATEGAQAADQAATSAALTDSFNQTATAIVGGNSATQAAFGQSVAQTQTAQANNFGQTQTAGAITIAQTQTAIAIANAATSTAQANIAATATAGATAQQQTQTAQAIANVTLTAEAVAAQQTATALALTPRVDPATLTALAIGFSQTQTAQSVHATETALAIPTPTPTNTPAPTNTPTPIPEADEVFTFGPVDAPTNFNGTVFAPRNLIICTFDGDEYGNEVPPGLPNCFPTDANGATNIEPFGSQTQPVIFPPSSTTPFSPINVLGDDQSGPIMVLTFPLNPVSNVRVSVALANQGVSTRVLYRLRAFDGEGQLVNQVDSNLVTGPAIYPFSISTAGPRIRQVQILMLRANDDDGNFFFERPLYVSRIAFDY